MAYREKQLFSDTRRRGAVAALVGAGLLAPALVAQAACTYEVTAIIQAPECPITGPPPTIGVAITDAGPLVVVGYHHQCEIYDEAFLWTPDGGYELLVRPPGVYSAKANDVAWVDGELVIVGTYIRSGLGDRGFVYHHSTGEWLELPPVNPASGWSFAHAINSSGVAVGRRSITDEVAPQNAFVWSADRGFIDLGLMGHNYSSADDISENGVTVGRAGFSVFAAEAFVFDGKHVLLLGPIPGGFTSNANAVSAEGTYVVGSGRVKDGSDTDALGFLWQSGVFTLIPPLPLHDDTSVLAIRSSPIRPARSSERLGQITLNRGL